MTMDPYQNRTEQPVAPAGNHEDAFSLWLHEYGKIPLYTRLDGRKDETAELAELTSSAQQLRTETKSRISHVVSTFDNLSEEDKATCLRYVGDMPIFPGLTAYTFTHLQLCAPHESDTLLAERFAYRRSQLDGLVERWVRFGDEWCISCYYIVQEKLLEILRETNIQEDKHRCNMGLIDGTNLLKEDILNLAALAAISVTGSHMEHILTRKNAQAKALMELFHALLEKGIAHDEWFRRCYLNALVTLSNSNGIYPSNIFLSEGKVKDLVVRTRGGFGLVYEGHLGSRAVAVKECDVIRDGTPKPLMKDLCNEAVMWRHLNHPNCLPFYGVYQIPGPIPALSLVSPWMNSGTLLSYLATNPSANQTLLTLDVVRGLHHLHSMKPHVAHRDLKPDNILVTNDGRACLADFGLMRIFDSQAHLRTATADINAPGTIVYMAPELHASITPEQMRAINKRACDIYALGCTIFATYTGHHPFHHLSSYIVSGLVMQGRRPDFPSDVITVDMWNFIQMLWQQEPGKRGTTELALAWMEHKAASEGLDSTLPAFEQEWNRDFMTDEVRGGLLSLDLDQTQASVLPGQ